MKSIFFIFIALFLASCTDTTSSEAKQTDSKDFSQFASIGDSITITAQQELLKNVGREMQGGGPTSAIQFCNIHASPLIDSLSNLHGVKISRISEKYRNIGNKPSDSESKLLQSMAASNKMDTIIQENGFTTYYKSIRIGMETCLKCHGKPNTDIQKQTLLTLSELYPGDNATGYEFGQFRGAWKVKFQTK